MMNLVKQAFLLMWCLACLTKAEENFPWSSMDAEQLEEYFHKQKNQETNEMKETDDGSVATLDVTPKYYADACQQIALEIPDYYNFEEYDIEYAENTYQITKKIGKGKYAEVFEGYNKLNKQAVAIKILKPIELRKIRREIKILQAVQGGPNIIELIDVVKDDLTENPTFVTEFVDTRDTHLRKLRTTFNEDDIRYYMYEILKALDYAHSRGVMHRDIKPRNIAIDHPNRKLRLIDWGLAEFYHPGQEYNSNVAAKHFQAPELLVGSRIYNYALDVWSLGCIFAEMLFQTEKAFIQG